jgi:hypothetical protein
VLTDTDYGYSSTHLVLGESLSAGPVIRWYLQLTMVISAYVSRASNLSQHSSFMHRQSQDWQAGLTIFKAMHLLSPAIDYFQLGFVLKVLWDVLKRPVRDTDEDVRFGDTTYCMIC